jgi:hypothetical protein
MRAKGFSCFEHFVATPGYNPLTCEDPIPDDSGIQGKEECGEKK